MQELLVVSNPTRRRRKRKSVKRRKTSTRKRRRNPSPPGARKRTRRAVTRRRSNPSGRRAFSQANITNVVRAAGAGAAGAIALDIALGFVPLPANLKGGIMGDVTKAVGAIAIGALANMTKFVSSTTARDMTVGAMTVQFTGIGRKLLGQFAPGIALSAYQNDDYDSMLGYGGSGWNPEDALDWNGGMSAYNVGEDFAIAAPGDAQPGLGAYLSGYDSVNDDSGFGW